MPKLSILMIGDADRPEFREAFAATCELGQVTQFPAVEPAVAALADGPMAPELIIVAQAYPSQFTHDAIDRLRRLAPLARLVVLLGSWCEGEMRTGDPWPATVRAYWHQWPPRSSRELRRLARGECSAWGLPATATEEERIMATMEDPIEPRQGLIAIHTTTFAMADWLCDACRLRGHATVWLRPPRPTRVEGAVAALFDGSDCQGEEISRLEQFAVALAPTPIIALLDFPRIQTQRRALAAGATAIVSKPTQLADLYWHMDQVLGAG